MKYKRLFSMGTFFCISMMLSQAFAVEERGFNLGQVVVSGTKTEHTLDESPVAVEVVTRDDFEERNVNTVQDALDLLTGVKVTRNSGSWGSKGQIQIQGLDAKYTLILVDGQRFTGGHNGVDLQQIPIQMIERIEIVKGPASALYGSEAVGGVVNVITGRGAKKSFVSTENLAGSKGTQRHSLTAGGSAGPVEISISYAYNKTDGVNKETDRYDEHFLHGSIFYAASPGFNLTFKPYYSEHKQNYEGRQQRRAGLNTIADWRPDELSSVTLRGSYFNFEHRTSNRSTDWKDGLWEGEINYSRLFVDRHTVITGYSFLKEDRDDIGKNFSVGQTTHSFFLQDEIAFEKLTFVLGGRLDNHKEWGNQVNPKLSMMYRISSDFTLRASAGTAFRAPTLINLYGDGWRMGPYMVWANPNLKPEESKGYQIVGEYQAGHGVLLKASLFRNEIKNLITSRAVQAGPPPWNMFWINVDEAVTQGLEFSVDTRFTDRFAGSLGYTYLDTEDKSTGNELREKPGHRIVLDLRFRVPVIKVMSNLEVQYNGRSYMDETNMERLGGYTVINLALTRKLGEKTQLFARFDNLTGKKNIYSDYDLDGREFLAGIRYNF